MISIRRVGFSNVTVVFQYALTCLAVPVLRRKEPEVAPTFRVPGGPLFPALGFVGSVALLFGSTGIEFVFAAAGITLGLVVSAASAHLSRRSAG